MSLVSCYLSVVKISKQLLKSKGKPVTERDAKKTRKKSYAFIVLILLTLAYIAIYYFLIMETQRCLDRFGNSFLNFFDRYLACRTVNELGDALAGAFAPVAFLWLAGAVFIQSQELLAQRQELDESQELMHDGIEVARQQLEVSRQQVELSRQQTAEARASAELFRKQTAAIENEQRATAQAQADLVFDQIEKKLRTFIEENGLVLKIRRDEFKISEIFGQLPGDFETVVIFHGDNVRLAKYVRLAIRQCIEAIKAIRRAPSDVFNFKWDRGSSDWIIQHFEQLLGKFSELSQPKRVSISDVPFVELIAALKEVDVAAKEFVSKWEHRLDPHRQ